MSGPRVVVVIPTWNGLAHLCECLPAVLSLEGVSYAVVVVDNGSTDGTRAYVRQHFPEVRVLRSQTNLGFAAANNLAIRATQSEYVATLNNDAIPDRRWLALMVSAADAYPDYGAVASTMRFRHRPDLINSAGIVVDRAGLAWDRWLGEPYRERASAEVFGACAGAALYRRRLFDDIGLFDERFFAYLEDVDLAWRAQWGGWRTLYVPEAWVLHAHSATGKEGSPFKLRLLGRNKWWLIFKNYPFPALLRYLPAILFFDLAGLPLTLLSARTLAPMAGRLAALLRMGEMWQARHQGPRRVSAEAMLERLAPLPRPLELVRRRQRLAALVGG